MSDDRGPLASYLLALCTSQNLTMRQASIRCGLDPSTIAKIVQRSRHGGSAEPATIQALAEGLGGDFHRMMVLAGHLEEPPLAVESDEGDGDLVYAILRLQEIWRKLRRLDPETANQIIASTLATADTITDAIEREHEARRKEASRA